jgi:hypothetical protein
MAQGKVELSVERVGEKLVFQLDPQSILRPGCSCCSNYWFDAAAIGALVLPATAQPGQQQR